MAPFDNIHDPQYAGFVPYTPMALSVVGHTDTSVIIQWQDTSQYVNGFVLERRSRGGSFAELARVSPKIMQFVDNTINHDLDYVYRVTALSEMNRSQTSNELAVGYRPELTFSRAIPEGHNLMALSPDNRKLVIQDPSLDYRLIDLSSGATLMQFQRPGGSANIKPIFTPDGQSVLIGYSDATICLWSVTGGNIVRTFSRTGTQIGRVGSMDISPDGTMLAAGVSDMADVVVWDLNSGSVIRQLPVPSHYLGSPFVAFSHDGSTLAVMSISGASLWNISTWNSVALPFSNEFAMDLSFDSKSTILAWAYGLGFGVYNISSGSLRTIGALSNDVEWVSFFPTKEYLVASNNASASSSGTLTIYRLVDLNPMYSLTFQSLIGCFQFTSDGRTLFMNDMNRGTVIWDVAFSWKDIGG
jgi:WD40 repeat protein